MYKLLLLVLITTNLFSVSISRTAKTTPIKPVPSSDYCYSRALYIDEVENLDEYGSVKYYCKYSTTTESSSLIWSSTCTGATINNTGSISYHEFAYNFYLELCSDIDKEKDRDGNDVVYFEDGIPYDKTNIENGLYFDPYTNVLECASSYYNINNSQCLQPNYFQRNLADLYIKSENVVNADSNKIGFTVLEDTIDYNENGSINHATVKFEYLIDDVSSFQLKLLLFQILTLYIQFKKIKA